MSDAEDAFQEIKPPYPKEMINRFGDYVRAPEGGINEPRIDGKYIQVYNSTTVDWARDVIAGKKTVFAPEVVPEHAALIHKRELEAAKRLVPAAEAYYAECAKLKESLGLPALEEKAKTADAEYLQACDCLRSLTPQTIKDLAIKGSGRSIAILRMIRRRSFVT